MEISEIKSHLTILEVLKHYNLEPESNNLLSCPWHNDKTPSLQIYPKTNTWTCFSSNCNAGSGDVIDFIMKYEKETKHKAILIAKELLGHQTTQQHTAKEKAKPAEELSRIAVLSKFYRQLTYRKNTKDNTPMVSYLQSRGLEMQVVGPGYYSQAKYYNWKRDNKDWYKSIERYGLNRFIGCAVFGLRNVEGQIVGLYGRHTTNEEGGKHYYLSGSHQGLYPHWPKSTTTKLILTESVIDAASLLDIERLQDCAVLALYGGNGSRSSHERIIGLRRSHFVHGWR